VGLVAGLAAMMEQQILEDLVTHLALLHLKAITEVLVIIPLDYTLVEVGVVLLKQERQEALLTATGGMAICHLYLA
jgi:hypothetical protein